MDVIFGYIERITFQNPETGFTIAHIKRVGSADLICVVGTLPSVVPGETIRCWGSWKQHLLYGKQFEVTECKIEAPADLEGIRKYLGSGLIKGIGPVFATKIVALFGIETLNIIDREPSRLREIEGLGPKKMEMIINCWSEQRCIRDVMIFLQGHGISPTYAQKIYKTYGNNSPKILQEEPYRLAVDINGIGFKKADAIAEKLKIPHDSPQRIDAGCEFFLRELASEGHVCYPKEELISLSSQTLEIETIKIEERLNSLIQQERLELFPLAINGNKIDFLWLKPYFLSEIGIAKEIKRLRSHPCPLRNIDTAKALEWVQKKLNINLADNQSKAVVQSLVEKMTIITGGPGTGKSTITKAILAITGVLTDKILLAAPTGRAAKRMTEICGYKASTLHSVLEYDFKNGGFKRNRQKPLECDLIIIDEASMIDTFLMYNVLKAIPDNARIIFVGDINQLPSVGAGNVLKDVIESKVLPVTMLNEIFRQAQGSKIITNAHRINQGVFPDITSKKDGDFFFIEEEDPEKILEKIILLVTKRLPQKYQYNPFTDIQILAPMKRGIIGTENLNVMLQQTLIPQGTSLMRMGRRFLCGDKVMQTRNNYEKGVFNGDIGIIKEIDLNEQQLLVAFEDREVVYEASRIDELILAYAVSIHKYQGSECRCVIMPVHTTHFKMLHRNLLYTGVTRGKELVIIVGTKKALAISVNNDEVKKRYTGLLDHLVGINTFADVL